MLNTNIKILNSIGDVVGNSLVLLGALTNEKFGTIVSNELKEMPIAVLH